MLTSLLAFNRGLVSRYGLARIDLKRMALSAQVMTNWMPRVLGSMMLRPGLGYIGATLNNAAAKYLPFVFSTTDTALLEMTDSVMRVWINDVLLTRPAVSSAVTNGAFATNIAGWTDSSDSGGVPSWVAPGYMQLTSNGTARAILDQQVINLSLGIEHALRVVVVNGPVSIRVGSALGNDDYVTETVLNTGTHSLSFVPSANFYIRFFTTQIPWVWVSNCTIEAAGVVQIPTPWTQNDLDNIRIDQSADVVYVACKGHQQRQIERRGTRPNARSWSVCLYVNDDGPFKIQNVTTNALSASGISGNVGVTATLPTFRSTHVGALFSITSIGQSVSAAISAQNVFTNSIRVTGISDARTFSFVVAGTFVATVQVQRSYDNATWANIGTSLTAAGTVTVTDGLNNQIVYYRCGIPTGSYTSGTAVCTLQIGSGSIRGIVRVTQYLSPTGVNAEVVVELGGTSPSTVWQEGQWSDANGWPTSVSFHEGRLWWAGNNGIWGSVSDAYTSFDETTLGDSAPINRTIGSGPVDTINWIISIKSMLVGAQGNEFSVRASSLDEPLTPTNFNIKKASSQGSASVKAINIDQSGVYVNRSGIRVYEMAFNLQSYDYSSTDLTDIVPDLGKPGIVRIDCHRQPDTRIHAVRSDGIAIVCIFDKAEEVKAWVQVQTSGFIEDVVTLPALNGNADDQVYYVVRRTINGSTVRYLEKWAQESECRGDQQLCKLADSHIVYSGPATHTISGLSSLEGQSVVVWADGADVGTNDSVSPWVQTYTVSGGEITLPVAASNVVVGLPYTAQFQSSKLGTATADIQSPLNQQKKANHLGLILADVHPKGLQFGPSFDYLDDMPGIEDGAPVGASTVTDYDQNTIEFPGEWTTDMRLCLQAQAPRPCTVLAATIDYEIHK